MLEVHGGLLAWTVITFIILLVVLKVIAWKPILSALDSREREIRESLSNAAEARKQADSAVKDYNEMIAKARKEAQEVVTASKAAGEKVKAEIVADARLKAEKIMAENQAQIETEKNKAISEIKQNIVELSVMAAEKVIKKSINKNDHDAMIREAIKDYGQT